MHRKPYLKLLRRIDGLTAWVVDGYYIRTNIDIEFSNFGYHYEFPFIPKNELWLDREHALPSESHFFIDRMLLECQLMAHGMGFFAARRHGDRKERMERQTALLGLRGRMPNSVAKKQAKFLGHIHTRFLKHYSRGRVLVWIVNGNLVRSVFFTDFTEGGHDFVYPFVPPGEVWLDDDLSPYERRFVLFHELHERRLMGVKHLEYLDAHDNHAAPLEARIRRHPERLARLLAKELRLNAPLARSK